MDNRSRKSFSICKLLFTRHDLLADCFTKLADAFAKIVSAPNIKQQLTNIHIVKNLVVRLFFLFIIKSWLSSRAGDSTNYLLQWCIDNSRGSLTTMNSKSMNSRWFKWYDRCITNSTDYASGHLQSIKQLLSSKLRSLTAP